MPYITDKNDNHITDEDGNKIGLTVEYENGEFYKHREPLHVNDNGHLDCENRHIVIKEGINDDHAVCKKQLDQLGINTKEYTNNKLLALQSSINTSISTMFKAHEAKILTQMLNFRNEQIKNRIQRKYLTIPRKTQTFIDLFSIEDIHGEAIDLKNIIILNVWIMRYDRYHHAKSVLVSSDFKHIEFFYNKNMTKYQIWFTNAPNHWNMNCFVEWLRIPQPISIDNEQPENISVPKPESNE